MDRGGSTVQTHDTSNTTEAVDSNLKVESILKLLFWQSSFGKHTFVTMMSAEDEKSQLELRRRALVKAKHKACLPILLRL